MRKNLLAESKEAQQALSSLSDGLEHKIQQLIWQVPDN